MCDSIGNSLNFLPMVDQISKFWRERTGLRVFDEMSSRLFVDGEFGIGLYTGVVRQWKD